MQTYNLTFLFAIAAGAVMSYPVQIRFRITCTDAVTSETFVCPEQPTIMQVDDLGRPVAAKISVPDGFQIGTISIDSYIQNVNGSWSTGVIEIVAGLTDESVICFDGYKIGV